MIKNQGKKFLKWLLIVFLYCCTSACFPVPPPPLPPKGEVPSANGKGCAVTIISSNQFDAFTSVNIAVGQNVVVKLARNEYIKFELPEGMHWLRIIWQKWGLDAITIGQLNLSLPSIYSKSAMVDCNKGERFLYGVSYNSNTSDYDEKFDLKQLKDLSEDFNLSDKTLVPASAKNSPMKYQHWSDIRHL